MNDELGGKLMTVCCIEANNIFSSWTDDSGENKKAKGTRNCAIKIKLKFEDYKHCVEISHLKNKINYWEKITLM